MLTTCSTLQVLLNPRRGCVHPFVSNAAYNLHDTYQNLGTMPGLTLNGAVKACAKGLAATRTATDRKSGALGNHKYCHDEPIRAPDQEIDATDSVDQPWNRTGIIVIFIVMAKIRSQETP